MSGKYGLKELSALHQIARILARPDDIKDQFQAVLSVLSDELGMQRGMISILDHKTGEAWLDVALGVDVSAGSIIYRPGEGITGKVAQTGRPMAIADLGDEAHFLDRTGARKKFNRKELAFLCVPIFHQGRVVGVLSADKLSRDVEDLSHEVELLEAVAELLGKVVHFRAVEEENRRLRSMLAEARRPKTQILGRSKEIRDVLRLIDQVADTNTTVLVHGETGTGKELVAKAIHDNSSRASGPLVRVNCAAMPETLMESELFGHEKGAFTGAIERRRGCFELAHSGTFLLDEIGEMPLPTQAKLLRVLEERRVRRLGGAREIEVDVRVLAASNRRLADEVRAGRFREDLYFRLQVFELRMPPLRERPGDLPLLCESIIADLNQRHQCHVVGVAPEALRALAAHPWPGNVRELRNALERAVILAGSGLLEPRHFLSLSPAAPSTAPPPPAAAADEIRIPIGATVGQAERALIEATLRHTGNNRTRAAAILGISQKTLFNKLREYGASQAGE